MKRNLLAFFMVTVVFLGFNSLQTKAQGWTKVFEDTDNYIMGLWFVEENQWETGWILRTGAVNKTTDGGETWVEYSSGLENGCNAICFVDENTGYITNGYGKVFKSVDGGVSWTEVYSSTVYSFGGVAFKDAMHGVVSGRICIYTSDGGATWTASNTVFESDEINYGGDDTYFAIDGLYKKAYKSTNGGQSFTEVLEVSEYLNTSSFYDENHGLAGGEYQTCYVTSDGGSTWDLQVLGDGLGEVFSSGYYDADTIYVGGDPEIFKSVNGGATWSLETTIPGEHKSMFVTGTNNIYVTSIINFSIFQVWKKEGALPLVADFEADETVVCEGASIQYTDLSYFNATSWTWVFEGGTPATSTQQNPSVTYSTPGKYNVTLTVGRDGESASLTKTDYIEVYELPLAPAVPEGDANICTGFDFDYSVPLDENVSAYIWELSPANAGVLVVNMNEATLEADNSWTGDFTIRVKGANVCGEGPWSGNFEGTLHAVPEAFEMIGGGAFCENSPGVEIGLDGSETGIGYELMLDGAQTGNIVPGTGSAISFGMVNAEGYYEVIGSSDYCNAFMQNQLQVIEINAPGQAGMPEGPEAVCQEVSSEYITSGAANADSYAWTLTPDEAGTLAPSGMEVTITWNAGFSGTASLSVIGTNDCGDGEASAVLEVSVNYLPAPEIAGLNLICELEDASYSVAEDEGNTYTWEVSGGTVTTGQGTAEVVITWGAPGMGSIVVTEENENGCVGESESFAVTIDECTGISEAGEQNGAEVFPNPANDNINIRVASVSDVMVYSLSGQLLLVQKSILGTYQMDVSSLKNGAYIVKVVSESKASAVRINVIR